MSKILIIGAGVTGISAFRFFTSKTENKVFITDSKKPSDLSFLENINIENHKFYFGSEFNLGSIKYFDFILKSPGIPYSNPILLEASSLNIPIYTDIEFANASTADILAITGSNGKTTTTSLVGEIFSHSNLSSTVCGNIGLPVLDFSNEDNEKDVLVMELSSFQLKGTSSFKPFISAFLNFNPTHLDFHGSEEDYLESKLKIFNNLDKDSFAILNYDDNRLNRISITSEIQAPLFFFSKSYELMNGTFIKNNHIFFAKNGVEESILPLSNITLKGEHNLENILAAVLICKLFGLSNDIISLGVSSFKSIEHRLEELETDFPFDIFNDSKSTNPTSTLSACKSFDSNINLILGGMNRGADFSILKDIILNSVSSISLFGESKDLIASYLNSIGFTNFEIFDSLKDATHFSLAQCKEKEIVLFSPGCASWDQYQSYIERGNDFKNAISIFSKV